MSDDMVRTTDGTAAHEAEAKAERQKAQDRITSWGHWNQMIEDGIWTPTRKVYELEYLPSLGYDKVRRRSLRRRLSDVIKRKRHAEPLLWLLCEVDERIDGSAVLIYTVRGELVLADPGLMSGLWSLPIGEKEVAKRKKKVSGVEEDFIFPEDL